MWAQGTLALADFWACSFAALRFPILDSFYLQSQTFSHSSHNYNEENASLSVYHSMTAQRMYFAYVNMHLCIYPKGKPLRLIWGWQDLQSVSSSQFMDQSSSGRNGKLGRKHQLIFPKMNKLLLTGRNQSHFVFSFFFFFPFLRTGEQIFILQERFCWFSLKLLLWIRYRTCGWFGPWFNPGWWSH